MCVSVIIVVDIDIDRLDEKEMNVNLRINDRLNLTPEQQ